MNKKITNILILLFFIISSDAYCQESNIYIRINNQEKNEIQNKIDLIEKAHKQENPQLLKEDLSPKFNSAGHAMPLALNAVLSQMFEQLPKGNFKILHASKKEDNSFTVDLQISPFKIPLIIDLDKDFKIVRFDVLQDKIGTTQDANNEYLINDEHLVLPFHLIDGFIFIDGQVGTKKGKFMFDTGNPFGIFLNNNLLNLDTNNFLTEGAAGSGQKLKLYQSKIGNIKIGNKIEFINVNEVVHSDFSFIEKGITSDFLGFIGFEFIKNYEFVIDYDSQVIDLYLLDKKGNASNNKYHKNDIVTTLNFTTPSDEQIPVVEFNIANERIYSSFDTGDKGHLELTDKLISKLKENGNLKVYKKNIWYGHYAEGNEAYILKGLTYNSTALHDLENYSLLLSDKAKLGFGYQFLKNYITIWNYKKKTITLLKR